MADGPVYDVLVVGGGNAALCAAMAALEQGARVGIIEKAPKAERGGNSALTGHMRFPYNNVDELAPLINDPTEKDLKAIHERLPARTDADLHDEIMRATEGQSDQALLAVHLREAYNTIRWLRGKGHEWTPTYTNPSAGNIISLKGGGYELQRRSFAYLERHDVEIHYSTSARALLQDAQGAVAGVEALTPRGFVAFRAKATVLACGGFESNAEMRARYLGPGWDVVKMRGIPYNTGDGLVMALGIGAMPFGSWSSCHASPQDRDRPWHSLPSSKLSETQEWNRYAYPYSIMVNRLGQRFVDEADDIRALTYAKMGKAIHAQPGGVAFQLFDAKARRLGLLDNYDRMRATGARGATLDELAGKLGIDKATLAETMRTFNAAIQPGPVDPNPWRRDGKRTAGITPQKSNYALSVEEPPFEGYAVCCGITFTFGGLMVDPASAQVQHVSGRPILGLYTAGEMLGGLWHKNYASGSGMMAGAVFGRLAGTSAAKAAVGQEVRVR